MRAGAVLPFIAILGESGPLFEARWDVNALNLESYTISRAEEES